MHPIREIEIVHLGSEKYENPHFENGIMRAK